MFSSDHAGNNLVAKMTIKVAKEFSKLLNLTGQIATSHQLIYFLSEVEIGKSVKGRQLYFFFSFVCAFASEQKLRIETNFPI